MSKKVFYFLMAMTIVASVSLVSVGVHYAYKNQDPRWKAMSDEDKRTSVQNMNTIIDVVHSQGSVLVLDKESKFSTITRDFDGDTKSFFWRMDTESELFKSTYVLKKMNPVWVHENVQTVFTGKG